MMQYDFDITISISQTFNIFFQNVFLENMVSTVNPAAIHVSTICVTDMTDSVHTVVMTAMKETFVNCQVF
jgi:hypothetical protein